MLSRTSFFSEHSLDDVVKSIISSKMCIKAVMFDVLGTVFDWRTKMVKETDLLFKLKRIANINPEEFVESWVKEYSKRSKYISNGNMTFVTVDENISISLSTTLQNYTISKQFTEKEIEQLGLIWHRLDPWSDSVLGINEIKKQFKTGTFSNGNFSLLEDLSNRAKIKWDVMLSCERYRCYKPNQLVYQYAAKDLHLDPSEILLVASHKYDLEAAKKSGYKTAYVFRPLEYMNIVDEQLPKKGEFDFVVDGIDVLGNLFNMKDFSSISSFNAN